jgi:hypothetical protein
MTMPPFLSLANSRARASLAARATYRARLRERALRARKALLEQLNARRRSTGNNGSS